VAQPDEFYTFPDPSGNLVEFNPRTGEIRQAPNQRESDTPIEREPDDFGEQLATYTSVAAIFLRCLGRNPQSVMEAEGYGRFAITNNEAEREICSSPESTAWKNRKSDPLRGPGDPDPDRNAPPPPTPSGPSRIELDLLTQIAQAIADAVSSVAAAKEALQRDIEKKIAAAAPTVARATDDIGRQLAGIVSGTIPNVLTAVGEALGGVKNLVGTFLANAATVVDLAGAFRDVVAGSKDQALGFVTATASEAIDTLDKHGTSYVIDALAGPLASVAAIARRKE
jgi:hypothetical protein